ncbi:galactokinase [Salinibacter ruber]|jgi:galactokinase|uniref:galactokinase n=1 Tax=Salinibacter ruber TaxID=146919 RepID=UPI002167A008|nr:galactokinase [Salinibacter ruber]MCS4048100.1 galactokinase [Salinibacter ruber]
MSTATRGSRDNGTDPIFEDLRGAFIEQFGHERKPSVLARAPGRVNLIGGHTDYNDGFVLPTTVDRAVYVALRPRTDERVRLHSQNFGEEVEYALSKPHVSSLPQWAQYVAGVAEELRTKYGLDAGFEGVLFGNVPLGAGLSSSAALEVAAAEGLTRLFGIDLGAEEMALLCQRVEHTYVGVQCGVMDQMAVRFGRAGNALSLDCRTLEYEHVPLPLGEASIVIADSRVSRELAASKYNERRAECEEGVTFFQQFDDSIEALRDVSRELFEQHAGELGDTIRRRCRHVISENERVRRSADALKEEDLDACGTLMSTAHESLRGDYEVSIEKLDLLVETARATDGAYGARMTGAGFGGCVVCLVADAGVPVLQRRLTERYEEQFGRKPTLYVVEKNLEVTTRRADVPICEEERRSG